MNLSERKVGGEAVIGRNRGAGSYPIGSDILKIFDILRGVFSKAEVLHYFTCENINKCKAVLRHEKIHVNIICALKIVPQKTKMTAYTKTVETNFDEIVYLLKVAVLSTP